MTQEKKQQKILAIIPARSQSKGINKKNLYPVNGKPLIYYTISAALGCESITKTVVTTEDSEIEEYSKKICETIIRPSSLSSDEVPVELVVLHCIEYLKNNFGEVYDIVIVLQPSSPLRDDMKIEGALCEYFSSAEAISMISVYEPEKNPVKSFLLEESGFLKGIVGNDFPFMKNNNIPVAYMPNGAIYITKVSDFLKTGKLFSEKTIPYVMSVEKSIEVEVVRDIWMVEEILNSN